MPVNDVTFETNLEAVRVGSVVNFSRAFNAVCHKKMIEMLLLRLINDGVMDVKEQK